MTKEELISNVESKSVFIKWAIEPIKKETYGVIEKWNGKAFVSTPEGHTNIVDIWFNFDVSTNEATYQQLDTLDDSDNILRSKYEALETYCEETFHAFEIKSVNVENNWAIVTTYTLANGSFTKQEVIVYKQGTSPLTHAPIV